MTAGRENSDEPRIQAGRETLSRALGITAGHLAAQTVEALRALTDWPHERAARFMLLTAARREEGCGATWAEIDLGKAIWRLPAGRRKDTRGAGARQAKDDLVLPLSRQAVALLRVVGLSFVSDAEA